MQNGTSWTTGNIVAAVFALIILPGSLSLGFGLFVLNIIALACFIAPMVAGHREKCALEAQSSLLQA